MGRPGKIILTSFKAHALNKNEEKLAKLYQTVPRPILIDVYKKYKYDYELFGFDFNKVLNLAGYSTLTKNEETMKPGFYKTKNYEAISSWHKLTIKISKQPKILIKRSIGKAT